MKIPGCIALIGFPSSGKTTLGSALAQKLNFTWIDSDQALEEQTHQSPEEIILTEGQEVFRQLEHQWLQAWQPKTGTVLSTGGGLPCFYDNLALLQSMCLTIYLNVDFTVLEQRLYHPPVHTLTHVYHPSELKALHHDRRQIYLKADFCFKPANDLDLDLQTILEHVQAHSIK